MCVESKVEVGSQLNSQMEEITTMAYVLTEARSGTGNGTAPTTALRPGPVSIAAWISEMRYE